MGLAVAGPQPLPAQIHGRGMDYKTPRDHAAVDTYKMDDVQPGIDPETGKPRYDRRAFKPFDVP